MKPTKLFILLIMLISLVGCGNNEESEAVGTEPAAPTSNPIFNTDEQTTTDSSASINTPETRDASPLATAVVTPSPMPAPNSDQIAEAPSPTPIAAPATVAPPEIGSTIAQAYPADSNETVNSGEEETSNTNNLMNSINFVEFNNDSLGISLMYPDSWDVIEDTQAFEDGSGQRIDLSIQGDGAILLISASDNVEGDNNCYHTSADITPLLLTDGRTIERLNSGLATAEQTTYTFCHGNNCTDASAGCIIPALSGFFNRLPTITNISYAINNAADPTVLDVLDHITSSMRDTTPATEKLNNEITWETYVNNDLGVTLDYPSTWSIDAVDDVMESVGDGTSRRVRITLEGDGATLLIAGSDLVSGGYCVRQAGDTLTPIQLLDGSYVERTQSGLFNGSQTLFDFCAGQGCSALDAGCTVPALADYFDKMPSATNLTYAIEGQQNESLLAILDTIVQSLDTP